MFMRENRRKNGAKQPEQVASAQAAGQRTDRKLSHNDYVTETADDWRFQAQLSTCDKINDQHYSAGLADGGPYQDAYQASIPVVGKMPPMSGDQKLKG